MHRQFWVDVECPHCGLTAHARRTLPGKPWHIRVHLTDEGETCPPLMAGRRSGDVAMIQPPVPRARVVPGQGRLDLSV
jgi:hypothetical protein